MQLLRFDGDKGRWFAITELRCNFSQKAENALHLCGTGIEVRFGITATYIHIYLNLL